jgi:hypothetical protein
MKHLLLSLVLLDLPTSTTKTKKSIVRPATIYAISVTSRDGKTWTIVSPSCLSSPSSLHARASLLHLPDP